MLVHYAIIIVICFGARVVLSYSIWFSERCVARFERAVMHKKGNSDCSNITPAGRPMLRFCPFDPLSNCNACRKKNSFNNPMLHRGHSQYPSMHKCVVISKSCFLTFLHPQNSFHPLDLRSHVRWSIVAWDQAQLLSGLGRGCDLLVQRSQLLAWRAFVFVLSLRPPRLGKVIPVSC